MTDELVALTVRVAALEMKLTELEQALAAFPVQMLEAFQNAFKRE